MNVKFVTVEPYGMQERKIIKDFEYIKIYKLHGILSWILSLLLTNWTCNLVNKANLVHNFS
jgi:hypothetical protein